VLPPDYADRLEHVGTFGHLTVRTISRRDLILMKLFGMRAEDVEDLRTLAPTLKNWSSCATSSRGSPRSSRSART
jgi:hypothetical protein